MIRGSKKRFDDRFGVPMELFLGSLKSASLTYNGDDTLFNTFSTPGRYENYLQDRYDSAKDSVEMIVAETLNKTHKLELIGDIITEVKASISLLSIDLDGKITHKNFPGRRILKTAINESDFQEFYYYTKYFLEKMLTFLKELKKTASLTSQSASTIDNPTSNSSFKIKASPKKAKAILLFKSLVEIGCMSVDSESDFIKGFTGKPPARKINWIGNFGDLKTLIDRAIQIGLIDKVSAKWKITSNIFTTKETDFESKAIKDTKPSKNEASINKIVNSTL